MSYGVEFGTPAAALIFQSLPPAAQRALVVRCVDLADRPWDDARVRPPGDDPYLRTTLFGDGGGVLDFRVDDARERVQLLDMVWLG